MPLLRLVFALALVALVLGTIFALAVGLTGVAGVHETQVSTGDGAWAAMRFMVRELRQAAKSSITLGDSTGAQSSITYRVADDLDLNGYAVNTRGNLELSAPRRIRRDPDNPARLVLEENTGANTWQTRRVLANCLAPDGAADRWGVRFRWDGADGGGRLLRIDLRTERRPGAKGPEAATGLTQLALPRN